MALVTLNYQPHAAQREIHLARDKRWRIVCTGRRFGKTLCLAAEIIDCGGGVEAGDYAWVAPTYGVADRGIEAFQEIAPGFVTFAGRNPVVGSFTGAKGPCRIFFLSADNPVSLLGYGFIGMVLDEASKIPVNVWTYTLRATLSDHLGWAVFIGTPSGRNWFYDLFTRGLDPTEKDYTSFTFGSNASPYFPACEWDDAKRDLPETVFRQEYEAEFLEDSAGVFRHVDACTYLLDSVTPVSSRSRVLIGCDLAKHTDFTVLIAMDGLTGRCFDTDRFNHLDWPIQKERILAFARLHHGRLILDATGVGDPIYDDLKRVYGDIEAFKFTSTSKTDIVQRLIVAVEQRQVAWPASWEVLTAEMKRYEYKYSATGSLSYSAPSGYHDDCVMALALANHGRWQTSCVGHMLRVGALVDERYMADKGTRRDGGVGLSGGHRSGRSRRRRVLYG